MAFEFFKSVIEILQFVKILMEAIHVNVDMVLKVMVKSVWRLMNVLLAVGCQLVTSQVLIVSIPKDHMNVNVLRDTLVMAKLAMTSMNV